MKFMLPKLDTGFIKWALHPSLCLDAPGGKELMLWNCESGNHTNMMFTVPKSGQGPIRVASRPSQCIEVQEPIPDHGRWLQVWDCDDEAHKKNMQFSILSDIDDCQWTDWSSWSACSKKCGTWGTRTRTRNIAEQARSGKDCEGSTSELIGCQRVCGSEDDKEADPEAKTEVTESDEDNSPSIVALNSSSRPRRTPAGQQHRGSAQTVARPLGAALLLPAAVLAMGHRL
jgi:hypothetical protein